MLLTYDAVLWLLAAFHVVGGAALFRRLFPDESPWLGFVVPALALVMVLNFVEHLVALPVLAWLLPFTIGGLSLALLRPGLRWEGLRLPTAVFLLAFAFNFSLKCLHPEIPTDDSMADLNRVLDFSFGGKLPPTDSWLPPLDHRWYYTFQHYAASVVERLFALDPGTGYNLSFTLLNSFICLLGGGIAHVLGGRRVWVTLGTMAVLEAGFTGALPVLMLTMKQPDLGYAVDLDAGFRNHDPGLIFQLLKGDPPYALVLEPPGDWIWHTQYHANLAGFFLMFLAALAALLALDGPRSRWPWCLLLIVPALSFLAATWYLPICAVLCGTALGLAPVLGRRPTRLRPVIAVTIGALALLLPALVAQASWPGHRDFGWTTPEQHTPFWIFVIQWWPVYLPWLVLCFFWRGLSAGGRWLHLSIGGLFILVELFNVGGGWRWDTVEKMWGGIFGLGLVGLVPPLLLQRDLAARAVAVLIFAATIMTFQLRLENARQWVDWNEGFLHLDGSVYLRTDPQKGPMLRALGRLHARTVLAGVCNWNYTPPVGPVVFSMNRCYVAWFGSEQICGHADEAAARTALNNRFYAGQMAQPLAFLRDNRIDAVLIAPEDRIADGLLERFRAELAPDFDYDDCRNGGEQNAGVFLRREALRPKS